MGDSALLSASPVTRNLQILTDPESGHGCCSGYMVELDSTVADNLLPVDALLERLKGCRCVFRPLIFPGHT